MADQLSITNAALGHLGSRPIASLDEPREAPRVCALEWEAAVRWCLEMTGWQFATRSALVAATGATPPNQFASTFQKPADWIKTVDISTDGRLSIPLEEYVEEGPYWFANPAQIFVRYVSSDPAYGFNVGRWPTTFADLVALRLAERAARRIANAADLLGEIQKRRTEAAQEALTVEEQGAARTFPLGTLSGETRLQIYNAALAYLGRPRLVSLTQANDAVRELNDQWRTSVRWALQQAPWNFAALTVELKEAPYPAGDGLAYTFARPTDHILTCNLALDVGLQQPLDGYVEEGGLFYANSPTIFLRYVSADQTYGLDPTRWSPPFVDLVALRLAEVSAGRLTQEKDLAKQLAEMIAAAVMAAKAIEAETVGRLIPATGQYADQLRIWNDALRHLRLPRLASLTEVSSVTRELGDLWTRAILWSLAQGPWAFAMRTITLEAASVTPMYGFSAAYPKPPDWLRTIGIMASGDFRAPLMHYADQDDVWYTNTDGLAVRYISTDPDWGFAFQRWSEEFSELVALRLAEQACPRLTGSDTLLSGILSLKAEALKRLRAHEAINQEVAFPPPGTWTRSRRGGGWRGGFGGYGDGGRLPPQALPLSGTRIASAGSRTDQSGAGAIVPEADGFGLGGNDERGGGDDILGGGSEPTTLPE